jgi:hypothetical protein
LLFYPLPKNTFPSNSSLRDAFISKRELIYI